MLVCQNVHTVFQTNFPVSIVTVFTHTALVGGTDGILTALYLTYTTSLCTKKKQGDCGRIHNCGELSQLLRRIFSVRPVFFPLSRKNRPLHLSGASKQGMGPLVATMIIVCRSSKP